ncbi:BTAD domain-containing putative transcriptional regulator [Streptomyces sp. NPDC048291]|uniref:AfsR/SARP family transcriptional regulator n=1 Tax=Streptomyces sp. NPDC048291 TaxID=3365530 RepID=UPI0037236E2D
MSQVEFRLLGPVDILNGEQSLGLATPQQRGILASLLLDANRVVPIEKMLRAIWGEEPTESARNAVQGYISKIRRILAPFPDCGIATSPQGYSLQVDRDRIDLYRFRHLVDVAHRSDAAHSAEHLKRALELWQGPALTGVAGQWLPSRVGTYLEEERLSALEDHAAAVLAVGRLREAIAELTTLVVDHPLRERAAGLLMAALHRAGRRADALTVFRNTRHHLVRELGIEPGTVLHRTHQQILSDAL